MSKTTLIAAVVFAVLLFAVFATLREKPERGMTRVSFADVTPSDVTRVVATGKNTFELQRTEDGWQLSDGRPARKDAADRLAESIPKIESSAVITQNPDRFAELEVDDAGTTITAYGGDRKLAEFTVGKDGQSGAHILVDDRVYAPPGVYQAAFRRDPDAWTEKKLFAFAPNAVRRVDVELGDGTSYALVQADGSWALEDPSVLPQGFRFDAARAGEMVRALASARAEEVLATDPGPETSGLDGTTDVLRLTVDGEEPYTLTLGAENDAGAVYGRAAGLDYVAEISGSVARRLRQRPEDFRSLSLMEIEPDAITRLEIVSGDQQLQFERASVSDDWKIASSSEVPPEDFEFDPTKVSARLSAITASRAIGMAPPGAAPDFSAPSASLTMSTEDGTTAHLLFADATEHEGQKGVLARGNVDDATYLVAEFARSHLTGGLETFRKMTPPHGQPSIDPAALQNLSPEVRQQLLQQMANQPR